MVERKNRTLVEATRIMISESKLPTYFWAEAVNTACYTQNRTLINKDHEKTLYEIMANKKPSLKYFHVFGTKCFVLKDGNEHLGKFDAKAEEGIFIGYSLESKAYRVYVIADQKVVESLNVTFDDTKLPSLQTEEDFESLKFEDLSEDLSDNEEVPEVVPGDNNDNNDSGPSGDSGGSSDQTNTESTSQGPESSPQPSINSGGAG